MDYDGRARPFGSTRMPVGSIPVARPQDASGHPGAAVIVVALVCAMSGLLMGLALTAAHLPLLAFLSGALLAGGVVWFARPLMQRL